MPSLCRPLALATALVCTPGANAGHASHDIVDVLVTASQLGAAPPTARIDGQALQARRPATSDSAALLRGIPGISLYGAGGVSSLPAIRGLGDDRLRIRVDGMDLVSACGNHMNPPLSYIDPNTVASIEVFAGVTPVSLGGDSIGGTLVVNSAPPEFGAAPGDTLSRGTAATFYRSNGDARGLSGEAVFATDRINLHYSGAYAQANNYRAGADFKAAGPAAAGRDHLDGDVVGSSAYETQNHKLGIALRSDRHLLDLELGYQHIPHQGFPNQRMDMTENTSTQVVLKHSAEYQWGSVDSRIYNEQTRHAMDFGPDKLFWYGPNAIANGDGVPGPIGPGANGYAAGMPMDTEGDNRGLAVSAAIELSGRHLLQVGGELQRYRLDDWWEPSGKGMWPNTLLNINDGERDRHGLYGEWQARWNSRWLTQVGVRHERVAMDTGPVQGYNAMYAADAAAFNASDRTRDDHNWDFSAQGRFAASPKQTYEFGLARKTRSPNLYERYSWSTSGMAMRMVNLAGDGNGYVGNLNLEPEIAHTLSLSADRHHPDGHWQLVATPFVTLVDDYVEATLCTRGGCNAGNALPGFRYLTFANQDALLYGVDLSGFRHLGDIAGVGSFTLRGLLNYLEGENETTGDNLYNIMPLNGSLSLEHQLGSSSTTLEVRWVDAKDHTSAVRNELATAGYTLVNLSTSYSWNRVRPDLGIENLLDKAHDLPLGGAYVGQGKTMSAADVPWGIAVPGSGRSLYAGLSYSF